MNFMHWMDGFYGVPAWMWLTLIAAGCLWVILWSMVADSSRRDRAEMARVIWLHEEDERQK